MGHHLRFSRRPCANGGGPSRLQSARLAAASADLGSRHHYHAMNIRCIFLAILSSLVLGGCATNTNETRNPRLLVGTFYIQTGDRRTEILSKKDGAFSSNTTISGKDGWTTAGEWRVSDCKLHGIYVRSSLPDWPLGEVDSRELLEVTPTYYVIKTRNGVTKKYQRSK